VARVHSWPTPNPRPPIRTRTPRTRASRRVRPARRWRPRQFEYRSRVDRKPQPLKLLLGIRAGDHRRDRPHRQPHPVGPFHRHVTDGPDGAIRAPSPTTRPPHAATERLPRERHCPRRRETSPRGLVQFLLPAALVLHTESLPRPPSSFFQASLRRRAPLPRRPARSTPETPAVLVSRATQAACLRLTTIVLESLLVSHTYRSSPCSLLFHMTTFPFSFILHTESSLSLAIRTYFSGRTRPRKSGVPPRRRPLRSLRRPTLMAAAARR